MWVYEGKVMTDQSAYSEITDLVEERAVHVIYIDFSKAFDTICCIILINKLMKCRAGKQTVRWTENCLKY